MIDISAFGLSRILLNSIWFEIGFEYGKYRDNIHDKLNSNTKRIIFSIISIFLYLVVLALYLKFAKGSEAIYGCVHFAGVIMSFSIAFLIKEKWWIKNTLL